MCGVCSSAIPSGQPSAAAARNRLKGRCVVRDEMTGVLAARTLRPSLSIGIAIVLLWLVSVALPPAARAAAPLDSLNLSAVPQASADATTPPPDTTATLTDTSATTAPGPSATPPTDTSASTAPGPSADSAPDPSSPVRADTGGPPPAPDPGANADSTDASASVTPAAADGAPLAAVTDPPSTLPAVTPPTANTQSPPAPAKSCGMSQRPAARSPAGSGAPSRDVTTCGQAPPASRARLARDRGFAILDARQFGQSALWPIATNRAFALSPAAGSVAATVRSVVSVAVRGGSRRTAPRATPPHRRVDRSPVRDPDRPGSADGSAAASSAPTALAVLVVSLLFVPSWLCAYCVRPAGWRSVALASPIERPD